MSSTSKAKTLNLIPDKPTGSDDVMIIPRYDDDISSSNCLVVAPYRKSERGPTILAYVEHYRANAADSGFPWTILPVVSEAMPLKQAMDTAISYAKENGVYAIFVNQDGFSSESEKRQTDTKAMKTGTPKQS